jgi:uncharacterized OsmC-like protein
MKSISTHPSTYQKKPMQRILLKQVERAITLSAEKYCSASIMLGATANITHDFEIINVD